MVRAEIKPIWNSSSFLVYTGGLTVLGAAGAALVYLATQYHGHGELTGWALFMFVVLYAIAYLLRRLERPLAAGIFAFAAVSSWIWLVGITLVWWGWLKTNPFTHWSWGAILGLLAILGVAADARRRFRFPFIREISVVWFFIFVNVVLPAGGNWTATWALLVGLLYLAVGKVSDKPSTFWLHVASGALIWGALLYWFHTSDFDFAVISIVALVYVLVAFATHRSSWAVWGTVGFYIATVHYVVGSPAAVIGITQSCVSGLGPTGLTQAPFCAGTTISPWAPALAFGLLGFWLVGLGLLGRKKTHDHGMVAAPAGPAVPPAA